MATGIKRIGIMDYVKQTKKEIQQLHEKPIILGHSIGGLIAQKLAELGWQKNQCCYPRLLRKG